MPTPQPRPRAPAGGGPVDPEVAASLRYPWRPATLDDVAGFRADLVAGLAGVAPSPAVERSTHVVPGENGRPDLVVHVHRPHDHDGPLPGMVWIHGGGFVRGVAAMDDARLAGWCPRLRCVAVTVDYRLAPETPYPGALEDCAAAFRWARREAQPVGIDPDRLGVGGSSAGGGLAAAVALLLRDRGEAVPAFQCLVYPMLDDRMATPSSRWEHVPVWQPDANRLGWSCYLGERFGTDDVPVYAAPARASDLAGLPPALVACAAVDVVVDEGVDYALRLNRAGVPTDLRVHAGLPHGGDGLVPGAEISRRFRQDIEEWLARRLRPAGPA